MPQQKNKKEKKEKKEKKNWMKSKQGTKIDNILSHKKIDT